MTPRQRTPHRTSDPPAAVGQTYGRSRGSGAKFAALLRAGFYLGLLIASVVFTAGVALVRILIL